MSRQRIYLAGLSGSGKTSVAELLSRWLGRGWADVDREVERLAGRSIPEIWASGEEAFRARERTAVERLTGPDGPQILALGGGTLEDPASRERLGRWGEGVHLDGTVATLAERAARSPGERPLLQGTDPVAVLFTLATSILCGILFGAAPLRHTRVTGLAVALKEGAAKGATSAARQLVRRAW